MKISHIPQSTIPNKIEKKKSLHCICISAENTDKCIHRYLVVYGMPKLWTLIPTFLLKKKNDKKV